VKGAELMAGALAHIRLLGRHQRSVWVGGYYWFYCLHRSHRWGLPCWRWFVYDAMCAKHNGSCYTGCLTEMEKET
jgi:hypothetical protein